MPKTSSEIQTTDLIKCLSHTLSRISLAACLVSQPICRQLESAHMHPNRALLRIPT